MGRKKTSLEREKIMSRIAFNLKALRENNDLTLEQVANYLGLSDRTSYYAYEACKANLPIESLVKLCKLYKVSYSIIIDGMVKYKKRLLPKTK